MFRIFWGDSGGGGGVFLGLGFRASGVIWGMGFGV